MRGLSAFARVTLCALVCILLFTAAITTTGRGDSAAIVPVAVLADWSDHIGSSVTNVNVFDFTAATQVKNGWFTPPNPAWLASAAQFDGVWTPAGWQVFAATSGDCGTLLIALNRGSLTNRLWLVVSLVAFSDAELYEDLLDASALPVAVNLLGNLFGSGASRIVLVAIPLFVYPTCPPSKMLHRGNRFSQG